MRERPLSRVPRTARLLLAAGLVLQLAWHTGLAPQQPHTAVLQQPPPLSELKLMSFGEPVALARMLALHVQTLDLQHGNLRPLRHLDYDIVLDWLARILDLDPAGQYPLFLASHVYAEVPDPQRQRQMMDFIHRRFLAAPEQRWPALAHVTLLAKHRLKDLPLARRYAAALRQHATGPGVPHWVQQMEIFILEDMSEAESARILLGALLQSGQITDPHEFGFLRGRLEELERAREGEK